MKKIALILFLLFSCLGFSQVKGSQTLKWAAPTAYFDNGSNLLIPKFDGKYFSFDGTRILFGLSVPVTSAIDEKSLVISDAVYESISTTDLGQLPLSGISASMKAEAHSTKARGRYFASISLNPIIKDASGYKRLVSFSYSLKPGTASASTRRDFNSPSSSVLKSGDWYRFYVEKSGVYKISKSFLQSLGMKLNNVNPNSIHIYGNGGRMLPLPNSVDYPSDLAENAVYVEGGNDGVFDSQDYILFYAEGMDNWSEENETHNNLYADRAYYYVTVQSANGKRITPMPDLSASTLPVTAITAFDDYQFHEVDLINVAKLGRKWFGEDFSVDNKKTFDFEFPNFVSGTQISISATGAVVAFTPTSLTVKANGSAVGAMNFGALQVNGAQGLDGSMNGTFPAAAAVSIEMEYNNNGVPGSRAYLDYIILKAKSNLKGYGKQFRFTYDAAASSSGIGDYQFTNAGTITQVWDITDIYNVTAAVNANQASFSFKSMLGSEHKFIAVDKDDYFSPKKESQSKVANQDLKGTIFKNAQGQFQDIDYLIITPASLNSAAEKLAAFHRTYSGLNVKVVNLETIYPEFASGKQDIGAIRNFVKYVYNNASDPSKRVRYLNLFGDASYDFKNRIPNNTNLVPIWHALQSFSLSTSFISDDFYVLMDDNEGAMTYSGSSGLDIAVGRMPVDDIAKANEMVNKVIEYHDIKSFGRWRNNFVLISDDVDQDWEFQLENGIDQLGDEISSQKPFVNVEKIHSDSYVQEASAGGERYPKVNEDIVSSMNQGALVFNYFGHGGEEGLATERIFDKNDIALLNNRYKYPLFITITCEFTRFDNPTRVTAGEELYWRADSGAISLITTTRQIDPLTGKIINDAFAGNLFGYGVNVPDSIAEELRESKASNPGINTFMVFYIGDPALRLSIPKPTIVLTKVNDAPITGPVDDLQALGTVKLSGEIRDEAGNTLLSDYNGEVFVNVFDKQVDRKTLGNPGFAVNPGEFIMNFKTLGETLFRGGATVNNGIFNVSFVMPRDTRIPLGNGRVSFYAKKTAQLLDQTGYNTDIKVGGINQHAADDKTPPTVKLYMNDESFVSGGITNESPILLAILQDEHGINTASGIGHDIVAILDSDESNPYILNDYYDADPDDFTKGRLKFPFRNLEKGLHTLTFKAWDVYNNLVTAEIQFLVVGDDTLTLKNVLNYPNPFVSYTQFWFTHNKPFEPLEVQVQVMTITGKVVWTKNQTVVNEGFLSRDITWDGKDDFGDRIGKGVYVYKLTVRSTLSNKRSEKFEKLVIL